VHLEWIQYVGFSCMIRLEPGRKRIAGSKDIRERMYVVARLNGRPIRAVKLVLVFLLCWVLTRECTCDASVTHRLPSTLRC
jgi:hypothetical protein